MSETIPRIRVTDPQLATFGPFSASPQKDAFPPPVSDVQQQEDSASSSRSKSKPHSRQKSSTDTTIAPKRGLGPDRNASGDESAERPASSRSLDPLTQEIYDRAGVTPQRNRDIPEVSANSPGHSPRISNENKRASESGAPAPSKGHTRDRKSAGFFARIIGNKKKDDGDASHANSSEVSDDRPEGAEAEAFYQTVDNMGFSPRHAQPPPYIKVRSKYKREREFDKVFLAQSLMGKERKAVRPESVTNGKTARRSSLAAGDAVWAIEMSKDGRYLASAGQDKIIRVWSILSSPQERRDFVKGEESNMAAPGHVHLSAPVFRQEPVRVFKAHEGPILDLSWSKNNFLLSSSMDKTVRLWHVSRSECLCTFKHSDFVTSIQFHPRDDRFFLAGSLDSKLRLWSIPDKNVAYQSMIPEMITAVAFTPDGKQAIVGCLSGLCQFHETEGLRYQTSLHVRSRTGKNAKGSKITGIQAINFSPDKGSRDIKVLITSNDSRIRLYNLRDKGLEMKFKGNENFSSQIRARLTDDARYVVCGSEDNKVYIWSTTPSESDKKDKWPVEIFEAHSAAVTASFFVPTRARQLLSASEDPLYDLCNPPPVTLVSRSEAAESPPSKSTSGTSPPTASPPAASLADASPAYLSRTSHPDGNVIITADDTGAIKVFRQDCASVQRMRSDMNSETSSIKRASTALIRRSNSMATTRSNTSASGLARQGSTASNSNSRERILSWRQSIGASSTHSLDKNGAPTSIGAIGASSPALVQHRHSLKIASPRLSLSAMKPHFGRQGSLPSPGGDNASPTAASEHSGPSSIRNGGGGEKGIDSSNPAEAGKEQNAATSNGTRPMEMNRVHSTSYWTHEAWRDELKQQLAAPHRDLSTYSHSGDGSNVSVHSATSRTSQPQVAEGKKSTGGGLGVPRPPLEKTMTGWSALTMAARSDGSRGD